MHKPRTRPGSPAIRPSTRVKTHEKMNGPVRPRNAMPSPLPNRKKDGKAKSKSKSNRGQSCPCLVFVGLAVGTRHVLWARLGDVMLQKVWGCGLIFAPVLCCAVVLQRPHLASSFPLLRPPPRDKERQWLRVDARARVRRSVLVETSDHLDRDVNVPRADAGRPAEENGPVDHLLNQNAHVERRLEPLRALR